MPKAVYILCAESGSEDKPTGLISLYRLLEKLQIAPIPTPKEGELIPILVWRGFRVVAAWMAEAGDDLTDEYEYELSVLIPPNDKAVVQAQGTFHFVTPLHRLTAILDQPFPLEGPGIMRAVARIRKKNKDGTTGDWNSQVYPVILEAIGQAKTNTPSA